MPRKTLLLLVLLAGAVFGQATPVDCTPTTQTFTAATTGTAISNANTSTPCVSWRVTYNTSGFSALSMQFETSPDNSSWTAVTNSVCSSSVQPPCVIDGSNPATTTGNQTFAVRAYGRYVRLNVTSVTGSGTITARIYGYKGLSAGLGGGSGGGGGGGQAVQCAENPYTTSGSKTCTHNFGASSPTMMILDCNDQNGTVAAAISGPVYSTPNAWTFTIGSSPTNMYCWASIGGSGATGPQGPAGPAGSVSVVASGAKTLNTTTVTTGTCGAAQTATATGVVTTDAIGVTFAADPTSTTGYQASTSGMLVIVPYPTANTVNFKVCNNTASDITPGAVTLNWQVLR